ncbi:MAG: uroporphyrinogen decarboxylase family protein [Thermofilaceae archaeon]
MKYLNFKRYEKVLEENRRRLETVRGFEEPDRVPVIINIQGPYYARLFNIPLSIYYRDLKVMLDVQVKGLEWKLNWLKDDLVYMGVSLDWGPITEGVFFNCEIIMPDQKTPWRSPWIIPSIKSLEDIDRLEVPDPRQHKEVKKFYSQLEELRRLAREYYEGLPVGGMFQIHPPVSAAGSLLGPQRLYTWMIKYPDEMHKLFKKLEEAYVLLQEHYYEVTSSEPGYLGLNDDHAGYLSRKLYEKFALPYNTRLYERFGTKDRYLHMDSRMDHITDIVRDVYKVKYVDVGVENDISIIAREFKGKVIIDGNADWRVLLCGEFELIEREVEKCIYYAAPGGGYVFDNGGETYAEVPPEALKYEVEYAKNVGRYPINLDNFKHEFRYIKRDGLD